MTKNNQFLLAVRCTFNIPQTHKLTGVFLAIIRFIGFIALNVLFYFEITTFGGVNEGNL